LAQSNTDSQKDATGQGTRADDGTVSLEVRKWWAKQIFQPPDTTGLGLSVVLLSDHESRVLKLEAELAAEKAVHTVWLARFGALPSDTGARPCEKCGGPSGPSITNGMCSRCWAAHVDAVPKLALNSQWDGCRECGYQLPRHAPGCPNYAQTEATPAVRLPPQSGDAGLKP
jgi:hypothetical protein